MDKKKDKKQGRLVVIVVLIGILAWYLGMPKRPAGSSSSDMEQSPLAQFHPQVTDMGIVYTLHVGQQVMVRLNKSQWIGASCDDPDFSIYAEIHTRNVNWMVRLDGDDRLQSSADRADWAVFKALKTADAKVWQYKIDPSDKADEASATIHAVTKAEFARILANAKAAGRS